MSTILEQPFSGPMTWDSDTPFPNDGIFALDAACLAEIDRVAADLAANPLPTEALRPDDFDMPACRALMQSVREGVDNGTGFAIVDRLPVDRLGKDISTKVYWLLMSMAGRPVAQKWDGTLVYDVTDTGLKSEAGNGVRSSKTNGGQGFHNDNSFNLAPDFVGLLCLQTAMKGGISGIVSFESVYNLLLDEQRDVIERLYEPFYFDRQREHAPDDPLVTFKPVVETDGERLNVNFSPRLVEQGYKVAGVDMDAGTKQALDALCRTTETAGLAKRFEFERGQIQIVNNRRLGHRRTGFRDWPDPEQRRHLVRIWLRKSGRPFYQG